MESFKKMWRPARWLLAVLVVVEVGCYAFDLDGGLVGLGVLFTGGILAYIFSPKGLRL